MESDGPAYEMLWDCRFCGAKKLLGLTHRFCPSCGGPQNADERYFPSDADKTLAKDHVYAGADYVCKHCGQATGRSARHCGGCGAPFDGAREVSLRGDQSHAEGIAFAGQSAKDARAERQGLLGDAKPAAAKPSSAKPSGAKRALGIGCGVVLALVVVAVIVFTWKREGALEVTAQKWKREIRIETYGPVRDSDWCDSLPASARVVSRSRDVRDHRKISDGQECHTTKIDRGNGTFVEKETCTPKYRDEPVYDDKCAYLVNKWHSGRTLLADGAASSTPPIWPTVVLARAGTCEGCEREGAREETYTVMLRDDQGGSHSCDFDMARWNTFAVGSKWKGRLTVLGNAVECSSLARQ
jgi:hypothetical protein